MLERDGAKDGIIGGVFPLGDLVSAPPSSSLLSTWMADSVATYFFHNARSAIRHVVANHRPRRVWLPAYLCPSIEMAVRGIAREVHFYRVGSRLDLEHRFLEDSVCSGDAVLTINYFGRPLSNAGRTLLAEAEDVLWIEDCAQTLGIGGDHFGDVRIFSPRKIVGAPDGGVLVIRRGTFQAPRLEITPNDAFTRPCVLRANDPDGTGREAWYAAFQETEQGMAPCNLAMSDTSKKILERVDAESIFTRRIENYAHLLEKLGDLALFPFPPHGWVPFGFPLYAVSHKALWDHLRQHHVYAPRHWRGLPSPRETFSEEHALSNTLMTIPCDQRYDLDDMARLVQLIREVCP